YSGEAQWDADRQTWWVDRSQLIQPGAVTFSDDEAGVITGEVPAEASAAEAPPEEEPSLSDQIGDFVRESETAQLLLGLGMGGLAGATPGGFTVGIGGELTGVSGDFPRAFR